MLNRRRFLQVSSVAASTGMTTLASAAPSRTTASRPARLGRGAPHRIIHIVADGMSLGTLSCADQLSRFERGHGLAWMDLWNNPNAHTGLMDMRSLDSLVTDSAAASSSWGSGTRVRNGVLNVSAKDTALVPLMELFGQAGWKRGLVTTTEITHATPAGFTVSIADRGKGEEIALQYLDRRLNVYLGGGRDHFDPAKRKDKRDIWAEFGTVGYSVFKNADDLAKASTDAPWLGTFSASHLPYSLDRRNDPKLESSVPAIATMARRALEWLEPHDHFILQIEGGRVDHACHNNDAAAALRDQMAVDDALQVVLEFQKRHPETLVVVTTDHGNANMGLNGMGSSYKNSSQCFRHVAEVRASFPEILKQLKGLESDTAIAEVLSDLAGFNMDARKLAQFRPFIAGKGTALFDQMNSDVAGLGQLLANHLGIGFTGTTHTSDYVPIIAMGPGSERFRGLIRNTSVFESYTDLAGIDFRNPQDPLVAEVSSRRTENTREYAFV